MGSLYLDRRAIKGGGLSHGNGVRWIQTDRLSLEEKFGRSIFIRIGEMTGALGLMKLLLFELKRSGGGALEAVLPS